MRTFALASLCAGAFATMQYERPYYPEIEDVEITRKEGGEIALGVLIGFIGGGDFGDVSQCAKDIETIESHAKAAVADFKHGSLRSTVSGIKELDYLINNLPKAMEDCTTIENNEWDKLTRAVKLLRHPRLFALHVAKDILVNAVTIFKDTKSAISNWQNAAYFDFGVNIGEIVEKVFVGAMQMEENG